MHKKIQFFRAACCFFSLLLQHPAFAQSLPPNGIAQMQQNIRKAEAACGDPAVNFNVKRVKGQSDVLAPPADFARVVVLEAGLGYADGYFVPKGKSRPKKYKKLPQALTPTVRMGMDGQWMGALRGNDFITFTVSPGEHHLCAQLQHLGNAGTSTPLPMAYLSDMKASAGQTYYFQITYMMIGGNFSKSGLELHPLQNYQGRLLLSRSSPVVFSKTPTL